MARRHASAGFTIIELITVMALIGIFAAMAVPSFNYLSSTTKVKGAATELYLAMIRARSEAVKRNRAVAVVGDAAGWQAGWQIIADANNDGDYDDVASDGDRLVIAQGALKRVSITKGPDSVEFQPTGRISGPAPAFEISSEDPKFPLKRCLSADLTGRPYIKPEACP
jgi:type IV fimbrial biogenesis protein FimT